MIHFLVLGTLKSCMQLLQPLTLAVPTLSVLLQVEKARVQYGNLALSSACEAVLEISNAGNLYMDERAPWSLFKQGGAASEAAAKVSIT